MEGSSSELNGKDGRVNKGTILKGTVDYVKELKLEVNMLRRNDELVMALRNENAMLLKRVAVSWLLAYCDFQYDSNDETITNFYKRQKIPHPCTLLS